MKFFTIGLGIGSLVGAAISFLPNAENTGKVKDDVKAWVNDTTSDVNTLATSSKSASQSAALLQAELPQAQKTLNSLKTELSNFQTSIKPNLEAIKSEINQTMTTINKVKKL